MLDYILSTSCPYSCVHPQFGMQGGLLQIRYSSPQEYDLFNFIQTLRQHMDTSLRTEPFTHLHRVWSLHTQQHPNAACWIHQMPSRSVLLTQYRQHIVTHDFIDAAHHLPHVPAGHPCARLHGHRFLISIAFDGMNIPRGWPAFWQTLRRQFHNTCLNQQAGLDNPTSEKFSEHLFLLIRKQYASLSWVCIQETQTSNSVFDGERFHIWKNQRFESAIIQSHHSHTGRSVDVRLHLSGLLEKDRGWVRDFTEIKSIFKPLYDQVLDHHALDRQQAQPSSLSRWLLAQLSSDIPELAAVELYDGIKGACAWRKVKHHHVLHH